MSRGVKDLRELICVSRLTIRESDEEDAAFSDEEGRISRFAYASFSGYEAAGVSGPDSRHSSAQSNKSRGGYLTSPDSGFSTNGVSPVGDNTLSPVMEAQSQETTDGDGQVPHPPSGKKKHRKRKKNKGSKSLETLPSSATHELPKQKPLPPVRTESMSPISIPSVASTETESSEDCAETSVPIPNSSRNAKRHTPGPRHPSDVQYQNVNFDYMLIFLDATMVSEWLSTSNDLVAVLTEWCHQRENYVQFAHFWLSEMPELQRQDILKMEYSIVMDQFNLAFAGGREVGQVKHKDIVHFTQAVFKEYPATLLSSKGSHTFLTYLDTLTSERAADYKKLLTDVRCSTRDRQHAQWTLACRAFCLVSVWSAVLKFYRDLQSDTSSSSYPQPALISSTEEGINHHRMYHAIRNEYLDVIHYLVTSGKVKRDGVDAHERTLVFTAVIQNKVQVLEFLLKKIKCSAAVVNRAADNGNTPLHAAANVGDVKMVATLLKVEGIMVDARNPQCENATPLHLAVMHGHEHVVEMLLVAKADSTLSMGDLTPATIAKDFGHDSIVKLIDGSGKISD